MLCCPNDIADRNIDPMIRGLCIAGFLLHLADDGELSGVVPICSASFSRGIVVDTTFVEIFPSPYSNPSSCADRLSVLPSEREVTDNTT